MSMFLLCVMGFYACEVIAGRPVQGMIDDLFGRMLWRSVKRDLVMAEAARRWKRRGYAEAYAVASAGGISIAELVSNTLRQHGD